MTTSYKDSNIQLTNILLTQFEQGREVPALIDWLAMKPGALKIQERMIMSKVVAARGARRDEPTTVAVGVSSLSFLATLVAFIFGQSEKQPIITTDPTPWCRDADINREINKKIPAKNVVGSARELVQQCAKGKDFLIIVLNHDNHDEIRAVIDMFDAGRKGMLLVQDYGFATAVSQYEYGRERGFRLLEMTDGSGELIRL
jgi:hypothetical protein